MQTIHTFGNPTVTWIDVVDATDEELEQLADQYGLSKRTFDEAHRRAARPTMHRFEDHVYVVAFSGSLCELDMYLGPTWLITIRSDGPDETDNPDVPGKVRRWDPQPVIDILERHEETTTTSGQLFATLLDQLIDGYFDTTDVLEDKLEVIEDNIFEEGDHTEQRLQHDLFELRRELLELRRAVVPLREVLSAILRREVKWIDGDALVTCRDAFDKLLRAVDLVDEQRELVGNAVDAHLAVMSNQMNLVMKKLTAWGSIVFGATLIAGIYGMNFRHMPELRWRFGYPMALGMMVVLSVVLYRMFRKRDWL
jgi:magnesium transporter